MAGKVSGDDVSKSLVSSLHCLNFGALVSVASFFPWAEPNHWGKNRSHRQRWKGKWTKGGAGLLAWCLVFLLVSAKEFIGIWLETSLKPINCSHKPYGKCCLFLYLTNDFTIHWNASLGRFLSRLEKSVSKLSKTAASICTYLHNFQ